MLRLRMGNLVDSFRRLGSNGGSRAKLEPPLYPRVRPMGNKPQ